MTRWVLSLRLVMVALVAALLPGWRLLLRMTLLVLLVPLLSGCGYLPDTGNPPDPCSGLRAPDISMAPDPVFTADEQPRQNEVCQGVAQEYLGYQIVFTSRAPSGDIFDWADETTVKGSDAEPPPTMTPEEIQALLPPNVQLRRPELELYPQLHGPEGTIPFLRRTYSAYVAGGTGATSLGDWIQNYQVVGAPPSGKEQFRMYAGMVTFAPNQGATVWINAYGGPIEPNTMSLHEMVVGCRDPKNPVAGELRQMIGVAESRDNMNLNGKFWPHDADSFLRLRVEFLTEGPGLTGHKRGGWDDFSSGFTAARKRAYPPGSLFPLSTISTVGGPQYESIYQIKIVANGDWWVSHNGHWLGYYSHELFEQATPVDLGTPPNLLYSKACEVDWYGEVAAYTTSPWTTTDMGSGQPATAGFGSAANFRNPSYISTDAGGTWMWPDSDPNVMSLDPSHYNPACYSRTPLGPDPALLPADRIFFANGPGGDAQGCQYQ